MVEVDLLYFLIIALWCKMCRKMSPLLSFKTLESVHMHCVLGKSLSLSFYLSPCILCHKSVDIGLRICLYPVATSLNNVLFFPMPTFLFKEGF